MNQRPRLSLRQKQPWPVANAELQEFGPALSYWRGVWRRLCRRWQAMLALLIILALGLLATLGPRLWTVDPAQQFVAQVSLGIGSPAASARLVNLDEDWPDLRPALAAGELQIVDASSERVRLAWAARGKDTTYEVFRHIRKPRHEQDLGLPLGRLEGGENRFEDRLALVDSAYFYTIVAVNSRGAREVMGAVRVPIQAAISVADAQLSGLIPLGATGPLPATVELPAHPLGTDHLGRDLLARLLCGLQTSLLIGVSAPLIFVFLGTLYGAIAGYLGGRWDLWMMRVAEFVIALPFLLFMILLKVLLGLGPGQSGVMAMVLAMVLLQWPGAARLVRGQVLQLRELAFVSSARLLGGGTMYILRRHMLPNVLGVVIVALSFAIPGAIFTEAFLSFIGLGVVPPTPSLGSMCEGGLRTMLTYPHHLLLPAGLISLIVLAFNLLGDALRDALDVKEEVGWRG